MSTSIAASTASTHAVTSSRSTYNTPAFWEWLWRTSGLQFVGFFIITSVIYGYQPQVGASARGCHNPAARRRGARGGGTCGV